uniref:Uncharacterized protein n=1 Tax=Arundo donax TaxID=35708 RepID=A0A0A8ZWY3_ARUDO
MLLIYFKCTGPFSLACLNSRTMCTEASNIFSSTTRGRLKPTVISL